MDYWHGCCYLFTVSNTGLLYLLVGFPSFTLSLLANKGTFFLLE